MVRLSGLLSERPNPSTTPDGGCYYYATDEGVVYEDVGDWVVRAGAVSRRDMAGRKAGVIADRPAAASMVGWFYRATDEGKTYEAFVDGWAEYAPTANPTQSVATAAARKDPASYVEVTVGVTRVVQSDNLDIVYTLIAPDVTLDASWSGQPTVNAAGEIEGPLIGRTSLPGDIPANGEIVVAGGLLAVGNDYDEQGKRMISQDESSRFSRNRKEEIVLEVNASAADGDGKVYAKFLTSTGYCAFQRWDGVLEVKGYGIPTFADTWAGVVPATGLPWGDRTLKTIRVWPSDVDGVPSGEFTVPNFTDMLLPNSGLQGFHCDHTSFGSISLSALYEGLSVSVRGCESLTELRVTNAPNLLYVALQGAILINLLVLNDSLVTSIDTREIPAITVLSLDRTKVRYIDAGFPAMTFLSIEDADLYGLGAVGLGGAWGGAPMRLSGNNLTTDEVYKFVAEASAFDASVDVELEGNPCESGGTMIDGATRTAAETLALATSKNWNLVFVRS